MTVAAPLSTCVEPSERADDIAQADTPNVGNPRVPRGASARLQPDVTGSER